MSQIKYTLQQLCFITGLLFCFACTDNEKAPETKSEVVSVQKNPFPFYKSIEIKPGFYFEILSWGKGVDSIGAYQILMSDSVKNNFKAITVERKGIITDAWNMDLDNDGNPELYIELLGKKNTVDLNVFEYASGNFNKISFPSLSSSLKKEYRGNDKYFVKNGDLFRSFQILDQVDSTKKITKTLDYKLSGNNFSSREVKP